MLFRVIDIETTGMEPPAEIIELGRVDVVSEGDGWRIDRPMARLYRPLHGIPPETMAVHHITLCGGYERGSTIAATNGAKLITLIDQTGSSCPQSAT